MPVIHGHRKARSLSSTEKLESKFKNGSQPTSRKNTSSDDDLTAMAKEKDGGAQTLPPSLVSLPLPQEMPLTTPQSPQPCKKETKYLFEDLQRKMQQGPKKQILEIGSHPRVLHIQFRQKKPKSTFKPENDMLGCSEVVLATAVQVSGRQLYI